MRSIDKHIIHCSDSLHGDVSEIRKWHKARGFNDIGYHYVILSDGSLQVGRNIQKIGAHCKGLNTGSVGTCLIGKKDTFTNAQFETLKELHGGLNVLFPNIELRNHYEFNKNKTCPTFDAREKIKCQ
tara:strand:- start:1600 stop:1980 length:381 start_codon:yes stop_codon:yes gene_type:complete